MKVVTEEELAMRLEFRRPLHPPPEEPASAWCIPFEYGANEKGTRISIPKAKQIAAELLKEVAEAEKRELYKAFQAEKRRAEEFGRQLTEAVDERTRALLQMGEMTRRRRRRK